MLMTKTVLRCEMREIVEKYDVVFREETVDMLEGRSIVNGQMRQTPRKQSGDKGVNGVARERENM